MPAAAAQQPASAAPAPARRDFSFLAKMVLAGALLTLADWLFFARGGGSTIGLFALLLLAAVVATRPALLPHRGAIAAAGAAFVYAAALGVEPSLLAFSLFWAAAALAVLLPRGRFDDAWRWTLRLGYQFVLAVFQPFFDIAALRRARRRSGALHLAARLPALALPLAGSLVFLLLFASANPLIGDAFGRVRPGLLFGGLSAARIAFWIAVCVFVWSLMRPNLLRLEPAAARAADLPLPGVSLASVTLSLVAFNAIFAMQNALDIAFLWSGARLPEGMTLAQYAHRGAYPLIFTALLAALFVLVTLRPGTQMAHSKAARRLVYLWIAQNVFLVASTMLRTLEYVEAYSLTVLRIAALLWMGLVAVGLVLICYRVWRARSGAWLINANFLAAAAVLTACAFVDLGAVAAQWNVRHTRQVGGPGAMLDTCYLNRLGHSSLLPLIELESRPIGPRLRKRVMLSRNLQMAQLERQQADWRSWTLRGARRLAEARRLTAARGLPRVPAHGDGCEAYQPLPSLTVPAPR